MALGDVTLARDAVERPWITPRCATKVIPNQHRMCAAGRHAEKSFETTKQATFGKGHLNRKGQLNTSIELTYIEKESMNSNSGHTQCKASMRARARCVDHHERAPPPPPPPPPPAHQGHNRYHDRRVRASESPGTDRLRSIHGGRSAAVTRGGATTSHPWKNISAANAARASLRAMDGQAGTSSAPAPTRRSTRCHYVMRSGARWCGSVVCGHATTRLPLRI